MLPSGRLRISLVAKAGPKCWQWGMPFAFNPCAPRYFRTGFSACRLNTPGVPFAFGACTWDQGSVKTGVFMAVYPQSDGMAGSTERVGLTYYNT